MVVAFFCMGGKHFNGKCMQPFLHCTEAKIGMLEFQREVVMAILVSFGRNKPAKSLAFSWNVASNVKLDTKNHILVKGTSKYCRCKHYGCRSIYLCQNAMLPYTLTVSRTIIYETQNVLYCFLPEILIM